MTDPIKILIICKSGRLDCLADAVFRSRHAKEIYVFSEVDNSSLRAKAVDVQRGRTENPAEVVKYANKIRPHFAIIGPEEPLEAGVTDALLENGIAVVGPTQKLARIESSKAFARELLKKYNVGGNLEFRAFRSLSGIEDFMRALGSFVIKPDGLTGGKGVKVFGEHIHTIEGALQYCSEIFEAGQKAIVIEERLDGEEFSLQSFCDGRTLVHMPPVQDHKRAHEGDEGPNTGGMGSYSCEDHLLPFLSKDELLEAQEINERVAEALWKETGEPYKGILYGAFMLTNRGLRVIEYNARFGDPEIMNVLSILDGDFIDVCTAIINGTLDRIPVAFKHQATVCKYVVPVGYPNTPVNGEEISVDPAEASDTTRVYYAAVNSDEGKLRLTGSRAIAVVGIADNISQAEQIAEKAAGGIQGPVFHRADIGTAPLIARRVQHMNQLKTSTQRTRNYGT